MTIDVGNLDADLLIRIQNFVATDYNNKIPVGESRGFLARPEAVIIMTFSRVLTSWKSFASILGDDSVRYEFVHDGATDTTVYSVYHRDLPREAIL